ncbi:MAG: 6-phosphogluconolactonase [Polyangiales bacterium]
MNERSITIAEDPASFAEAACFLFCIVARHAIAARGRFVVALTGGSTPAPIHRLLAQAPFKNDVEWEKVVVLFGDERAVPITAKESNYRSAHEDLLRHVPAKVHRMEAERADIAAAAKEYEDLLQSLGPIDLLFAGLGKDAHVLSLYPGSPTIDETSRLVVEAVDPPMDPKLSHITLTPAAVAQARMVVAIASGEGKRDALHRALHDADDPKHTPAHVLRRAKDLRFVVDRAAFGRD